MDEIELLRAELDRVQHREAWVWARLRDEVVRNAQAESMIRQVQEQRDALWVQLNPEPPE